LQLYFNCSLQSSEGIHSEQRPGVPDVIRCHHMVLNVTIW